MYRLNLFFALMSKPRGNLTRSGRIYHSSTDYTKFNEKISNEVRKQLGAIEEPLNTKVYLALFNGYVPFARGQNPDLDNIYGAVSDALVKTKKLTDDNRKCIVGGKFRACPMDFNYNVVILGSLMEEPAIDQAIATLVYQVENGLLRVH